MLGTRRSVREQTSARITVRLLEEHQQTHEPNFETGWTAQAATKALLLSKNSADATQ
jgi:hypothetical protein